MRNAKHVCSWFLLTCTVLVVSNDFRPFGPRYRNMTISLRRNFPKSRQGLSNFGSKFPFIASLFTLVVYWIWKQHVVALVLGSQSQSGMTSFNIKYSMWLLDGTFHTTVTLRRLGGCFVRITFICCSGKHCYFMFNVEIRLGHSGIDWIYEVFLEVK